MKKLNYLALILLLLLPALSSANTYTLPSDAGEEKTPFKDCSYSSGSMTVSCPKDVKLKSNDILKISDSLTLYIDANLKIGDWVEINISGDETLTISVTGQVKREGKNNDGIQAHANLDAEGNIDFGKDLTWFGNISSNAKITLDNNAKITGNSTAVGEIKIGNNLDLKGNFSTRGSIKIKKNAQITGSITAIGTVDIDENLALEGDLSANENISIKMNAQITGSLTAIGTVDIGENLALEGDLSANISISINKNAQITGTLTAIGIIDISENLYLAGNISAENSINIDKNSQITGNLTATLNIVAGDNLKLVGNTFSDGSINIGSAAGITGNLTAKDALDFGLYSSVDGSCSANGGNYANFCTDTSGPTPTPTDISAGYCEDFESGKPSGWTKTGDGEFGVSDDTANSSSNSLFLHKQSVQVTTESYDLAPYSSVDLDIWIREGSDSFSENPESGEDLQLQYFTSSGSWQNIQKFEAGGDEGDIFTLTIALTGAALHSNFALRFNKIAGDDGDFDYWHIDDVCLSPYTPPPALPSPVLEYRFDEHYWSDATDQVKDSTTNGLDATSDSASKTSSDAIMCQAANFNDGDKFITSPDFSTLRTTASLSFWIKTDQSGNSNAWSSPGVTGIEQAGGGNDIFWGWLDQNGHIGITVGNDNSAKSDIVISDNTYHHIVLTRDAVADTYQIFIDGDLDVARAYSGDGRKDIITNVFSDIGRVGDTGGTLEYLDALIDEFIVFDSVLNTDQVREIFTLQSDGKNLDGSDRDCVSVEPQIHHYELERNLDQGLTCEPLVIESRACLDSACNDQVTGAVITTEFGPNTGWATSNTKTNYSSGDSFDFQPTDPGTYTLDVLSSTPSTVQSPPDVECFVGNTAASCDVTFEDAAFRFFTTEDQDASNISTYDLTAGALSSKLFVRALKKDEATGQCLVFLPNNSIVTSDIGTTCSNPSTCADSKRVDWTQLQTKSLANPENKDGSDTTTSVPVYFDGNGTAAFTLESPDIGEQMLSVTSSGNGYLNLDGSGSNQTVTGSVTLRVAPSRIIISDRVLETDDDPSLDQSLEPTEGNTVMAGENFRVKIQALDDSGFTVPSFSRFDPNFDIQLIHANTLPLTGTEGELWVDDNWGAEDEKLTTLVNYDEVSEISFRAVIDNFWGDAASATLTSFESPDVEVGEFVAAYLTATPQITATWGIGNAYQGRPDNITGLAFDIRAFSTSDQPILNYDNSEHVFSALGGAVLHKTSDDILIGGDLTSTLAWSIDSPTDASFIDDEIVILQSTITNLVWDRKDVAPTSDDINDPSSLRLISAFEFSSENFSDDKGACLKGFFGDSCPIADTRLRFQTIDRPLFYVRLNMPEQITASDQEAFIPVTLEYLQGVSDINSDPIIYEFQTLTTEGSLTGDDLSGLTHLGVCTLSANDATSADDLCIAVADSTQVPTSTFGGPFFTGSGTMQAGQGVFTATADREVIGLVELQPDIFEWMTWYWDEDNNTDNLSSPSSLITFGEFQGRTPLLFVRPMFR